jgi:Arc/MetJ-type ribon-helix-helix transcriptional regulator
MSILSVPLTPELSKMIDRLVKEGKAPNKAELARKAIEFYAEEQAIQDVLRAEKELSEGKFLDGDLDDLFAILKNFLSLCRRRLREKLLYLKLILNIRF